MTLMRVLADVRPTDVWDGGDVLGAAVLVLLVLGLIVFRVVRRR
ncbi:MAG: hypothetical protein V3V29_01660 [Acidimicrobiia bacterium]